MILLAIVTGVLTAWTIRRTTNSSALRAAIRRIQADLFEFRLYFDEPRLVWRAQVSLVRDNLRLFLLFLPAALILALPMAWLMLQLDAVYGLRPVHVGEPTVFTAQLTRPLVPTDRFDLRGRVGVSVETSPVRVPHDNQVAWRIRPAEDGHMALEFTMNGRTVRKIIMVGDAPMILSPRRSRSLGGFLLYPEELRLPEGDIAWLQVDYPKSGAHWLAWFLSISTASALITSRLLGKLN